MKNSRVVASRFFSVAVSFGFLFSVQRFYGDGISMEFFRTFSLVSLASIGWLVSLPVVNTRVYASSGRGAFRIKEIMCLYRSFSLLAVLGILSSTAYLFFYFSGEEVGYLIYAYLLLPMLVAYSRLLLSSLNISRNFTLAILIEGPVFFTFCFLTLLLVEGFMNAKSASVLSVFVGFLMVSVVARLTLYFTALSRRDFQYKESPFVQQDLMFVTGNGFIRNFFDNIVPVYAPIIFSSTVSVQLLIVWKLGAMLLIPLKAVQPKLAVSCSELIGKGEAFGPTYFAFVKYTLGVSIILAIGLSGVVYLGVLEALVGVDISLEYLLVIVAGFLALNAIGPGGVVCELLGMGRYLFCCQIIVFSLAFYLLGRGSFSSHSFLGFVFLLIGLYELVALFLAYKRQAKLIN